MKVIRALFVAVCMTGIGTTALAERVGCSGLYIRDVLTGPRHGAMMMVSQSKTSSYNNQYSGGIWICLDPEAEFMTENESERLFSFVMTMYSTGKKINLHYETDWTASACRGSYPVVEDIRISPGQ